MSVISLKKDVRDRIVSRLEETIKTGREELNTKNIHVMEISSSILLKNNPKIPEEGIEALTRKFIKAILLGNKGMSTYKPGLEKLNQSAYIKEGNRLLIISPNYGAIRRALSKGSKHSSMRNNKYLGSVYEERRIFRKKTQEYENVWGDWSLLDVGHTSDQNYEQRTTVAGSRIKDAFEAVLGGIEPLLARKYVAKIDRIHAPYKIRFNKTGLLNKTIGNLNFIYTVPQSHDLNLLLGKEEKKVMTDLGKDLEKKEGSKPIIKIIDDIVVGTFLDKAVKPYRSTASISGSMDVKVKNKKPKIASVKVKLRDSKGKFTSALNIQNLLNARLHDQIQKNMGKGNSTKVLNYRTGRFANSARILAVNSNGRDLIANYNFMRRPYEVFSPGGRLYKPGRDPEKIINRSIRQLANQAVGKKFRVVPNLVEGL